MQTENNEPTISEKPPQLCKHKGSGQAFVRLNGRTVYCGPVGMTETHQRWLDLIAVWTANGRSLPTDITHGPGTFAERIISAAKARANVAAPTASEAVTASSPTSEAVTAPAPVTTPAKHDEARQERAQPVFVADLVDAYLDHCETYYRSSANSRENISKALLFLVQHYGELRISDFGPKRLKTLQRRMIGSGWARPTINARIDMIRRCMRWGVSEEFVPASVRDALLAVEGLRKERTEAREPEPQQPVAWEHVEPILAHLTPTVRSMVETMWWTGMRTGELVRMTPAEIERSDRTWIYRPTTHKTAWRGRTREIPLGPRAQQALRPLLDRLPQPDPDKPLFSPQRSEAERRVERRQKRRTRVQPSQAARDQARVEARRAALGDGYTPITFAQAVRRGIEAANGAIVRSAVIDAIKAVVPAKVIERVDQLGTLPACITEIGSSDAAIRAREEARLRAAIDSFAKRVNRCSASRRRWTRRRWRRPRAPRSRR